MSDPVKKVIAAAKKLAELRDKKKKLEDELKYVNIEKGLLETNTLPKLMEDHEIEKMTIEGVGTLYTQTGVYASILAADRDEAHIWFKEHGHGDLVKEAIHHSTLRSWVKEQLEEGKTVPEFLHAKPVTTARIRSK